MKTFIVENEETGKRIDAYLAGKDEDISRVAVQRLIKEETLQEGHQLLVKGQFRSYNSYENEKNRLILTVFAKDVIEVEENEEENNTETENVENNQEAV